MKLLKTFALGTGLIFAGCASNHNADSRYISSEHQHSFVEPEHAQAMLDRANQDFEYTLKYPHSIGPFYFKLFNELEGSYYKGQVLLNEFDSRLDKVENIYETAVYDELLRERDIKDSVEERIIYYINRLEEITSNTNHEYYNQALESLAYIQKKFHDLKDFEKVAYVDLIVRLKESSSFNGQKSSAAGPYTIPFEDFTAHDFSWSDYFKKNDKAIKAEMNKRISVKFIKEMLDKAPNYKKIRPSTGAEGNLFGYNIPRGYWAITYDDGPRSKTTREIMNLLNDNDVKATFFWLAGNAESNRDMIDLGHRYNMGLANHSYSHANILSSGASVREKEIVTSTKVLERLYGQKVEFFRLPYGAGVSNDSVRRIIANQGLIHVHWSVDSLDWQDKNPSSILNRVVKQMEKDGRGIILFHDIHSQTVETTRMLMNYINNQRRTGKNLEFKTMGEIVDIINSGSSSTTPTRPTTTTPTAPAVRLYTVTQPVNVRTGSSILSRRCSELPAGVQVRVIASKGNFVRVEVQNPSVSLRSSLASCKGEVYISSKYIR